MTTLPVVLVLIGAGGAVGAYARFRVSGAISERVGPAFPWGTLVVNVSGSFLLGVLFPVIDVEAPLTAVRALIMVGFLGAFTTFSSFAYEVAALLAAGWRARAATYAAASLALGLASLVLGLLLGRAFMAA